MANNVDDLSVRILLDETLTIAPGATDQTSSMDLVDLEAGHFSIAVVSDQPSAADGLRIQYSLDDVTFYTDGDGFTHSTGLRRFPCGALTQYCRLQFEADSGNGGDATVRVQVIETPANPHEPQHKISSAVSKDRSTAGLVKAGLIGYESISDTMKNVTVNRNGDLRVEAAELHPDMHKYLIGADADTFGTGVTSPRVNQLEVQFHEAAPDELVTVTASGGATTTLHNGHGHFNSGTATTASLTAQTYQRINYYSAHEIYCYFTCGWIQPPTSAGDIAFVGLTNGNDGYDVGFKGTDFGIRYTQFGSENSFITAFNLDALDGSATSRYTRGGVPVAMDPTSIRIFRIRFGWLGQAPTVFEVMAPDGHWVPFHIIDHYNTDEVQTETPDLPVRLEITKTASDTTDIEMRCGCWVAGVVANIPVSQQPDGDYVSAKAAGTAHDIDNNRVFTNTPLGAGSTYTSGWIKTDGWVEIEVTINADQISAGDGIVIAYSDDVFATSPITIDSVSKTFGASALSEGVLTFRVGTVGDGFKISYTNGVTPQGSFLLEVVLKPVPSTQSTTALFDDLSPTEQATITRGPIDAKDSLGDYGQIGRGGRGDGLDTHIYDAEPRAVRKPLTRQLVATLDLTTTSQQIDASQLASRSAVLLMVDPDNNQAVHINLGSSATTASMKLDAGYGIPMTISNDITIHGRSVSGTQRVYLWQFGEPV